MIVARSSQWFLNPRALASAICVCATIFLSGCGGAPTGGRLPISGEVLLDGQPLDEGMIHFEPSVELKLRLDSGATISKGTYQVSAEHGLPPGKYIVSISSQTKDTRTADDVMKGVESSTVKERIAAKYNTETTLVAEIKPGPNKLDFKVESAAQ
ncbi:MAG: hypothetical protein JWP89_2901 [Schlesneria sp.]|nr:hypothetical protein [Schlesneria sp.]